MASAKEEDAVPDFLRMDQPISSDPANVRKTGNWYGWPTKDIKPVRLTDASCFFSAETALNLDLFPRTRTDRVTHDTYGAPAVRATRPDAPADVETEMAEKEGSEMAGPVRASPSDRQPYSA